MVGSFRKSIFSYENKEFFYNTDTKDIDYPDYINGVINNAPEFSTPPNVSPATEGIQCTCPCCSTPLCYKLQHLFIIFITNLFRLLLLSFIFALIFIGSYYSHSCPGQVFIPIFLIINGCLMVLSISYSLLKYFYLGKDNAIFKYISNKKRFKILNDILSFSIFIWLITGSFIVFKFSRVVELTDVTSQYFCDPSIFDFTFWWLITSYGIIATILTLGMCRICIKNIYIYIKSLCSL